MLLWMEYMLDGEVRRVRADGCGQQVPVMTRRGHFVLRPLGEGPDEPDHSPGHFMSWPKGQIVALADIKRPRGLWQQWSNVTVPVKIPAARFYYYDALGYPCAHELKPGQYLQGAMLRKPLTERVYFVLVPAPAKVPGTNLWWPRIVTGRGG